MTKPLRGFADSLEPVAASGYPSPCRREASPSFPISAGSSLACPDNLAAQISALAADSVAAAQDETLSGPGASLFSLFLFRCALTGASLEDEDPKAFLLRLSSLPLPGPWSAPPRRKGAAALGLLCGMLGRLGAMGSPWSADAVRGTLARISPELNTHPIGGSAPWAAEPGVQALKSICHSFPSSFPPEGSQCHPSPLAPDRACPSSPSKAKSLLRAAARLLLLAGSSPLSPGSKAASLFGSGGLEAVNQALGRPYTLEGSIVHGRALGRTVGMPTANLLIPSGALLPPHGVYATLFRFQGRALRGLTNVGPRPSVGGQQVTVETFLPGFSGDLYGQAVLLEFHGFIRGILKMSGLEEVHRQVERDVLAAEKILGEKGL